MAFSRLNLAGILTAVLGALLNWVQARVKVTRHANSAGLVSR